MDLLHSGCIRVSVRQPEEVERVGGKVNEGSLLGNRAMPEHNSTEVDRARGGKHLVRFGPPLLESRSLELESASATNVVDDLQPTLDLDSKVGLEGGEGQLSEGKWSAAIGLGSRSLGLKVCEPVADTVDVHTICVGFDVVQVSISSGLSAN